MSIWVRDNAPDESLWPSQPCGHKCGCRCRNDLLVGRWISEEEPGDLYFGLLPFCNSKAKPTWLAIFRKRNHRDYIARANAGTLYSWALGAGQRPLHTRQKLIEYLLTGQDSAYWLVGTRRIGKTSLLRQIEMIADRPTSSWVPLFVDLQGCNTPVDVTHEFHFALEDARFAFSCGRY